jgi:thioredoxin reductase (NADPH)
MPPAEGSAAATRLVLYSRRHCHLCEEMLGALRSLLPGEALSLEIVDVEGDPTLERRFGELVPILMHGEVELSRYRLDAERVRAHLTGS